MLKREIGELGNSEGLGHAPENAIPPDEMERHSMAGEVETRKWFLRTFHDLSPSGDQILTILDGFWHLQMPI